MVSYINPQTTALFTNNPFTVMDNLLYNTFLKMDYNPLVKLIISY